MSKIIVFVHGWSVTSLDTYGELPLRIGKEAAARGEVFRIENIFLGKYISFSDQVSVDDISRAFEKAVNDKIKPNESFICITHSTGGPVVRNWLERFHKNEKSRLTHLIMLAPANFGSALAQLGKSRISRLKNWFGGIEPGQKVLDWLELGSNEAWKLNEEWIRNGYSDIHSQHYYPFVLTGQSIDRKLYDNLNSYTGEMGSDGVVRVAAASLNSRYIKLEQELSKTAAGELIVTNRLVNTDFIESYPIPLRVITGKSHSGTEMGIMASIDNDSVPTELIDVIFRCISIDNLADFEALREKFAIETDAVQEKEKVEVENTLLIMKRYFVHDRFSQIIFKVIDSEGHPVTDYDLLMTAGNQSDPNLLPEGFSIDRQQNKLNRETVTYYCNYDIMTGCEPVKYKKIDIRTKCKPISKLGFIIQPRPVSGFVRYSECTIQANADLLKKILRPNSTTLIEIKIHRIVSAEVFRLQQLTGSKMPSGPAARFDDAVPGSQII